MNRILFLASFLFVCSAALAQEGLSEEGDLDAQALQAAEDGYSELAFPEDGDSESALLEGFEQVTAETFKEEDEEGEEELSLEGGEQEEAVDQENEDSWDEKIRALSSTGLKYITSEQIKEKVQILTADRDGILTVKTQIPLESASSQSNLRIKVLEKVLPSILEKVVDVKYLEKNQEKVLTFLKKSQKKYIFSFSRKSPDAYRVKDSELHLALGEEEAKKFQKEADKLQAKADKSKEEAEKPQTEAGEYQTESGEDKAEKTIYFMPIQMKVSLANIKQALRSNNLFYASSNKIKIIPFINFIDLTSFSDNFSWWKKDFSSSPRKHQFLKGMLEEANKISSDKLNFSLAETGNTSLEDLSLTPSLDSIKKALSSQKDKPQVVILGNFKLALDGLESSSYSATAQLYVHHIDGPSVANSFKEKTFAAKDPDKLSKQFEKFALNAFSDLAKTLTKKSIESFSKVYQFSITVEFGSSEQNHSHFRALQQELDLRLSGLQKIKLQQISSSSIVYNVSSSLSSGALLDKIKLANFSSFDLKSSSKTWGDDLVIVIAPKQQVKNQDDEQSEQQRALSEQL